MADDEYDTFFDVSSQMGQSQLSDQMMWLDEALRDEFISQETPMDLRQNNPITSYQPTPNQVNITGVNNPFTGTLTRENSVKFYQQSGLSPDVSEEDLSISTPERSVTPAKRARMSASRGKKSIDKLDKEATSTNKSFILEYTLHLPAGNEEKKASTRGSHKRQALMAEPNNFVKFESKGPNFSFK
ncbi:hypothetical protein PSHT_10378 [Puccinia striiformis]|uniref:Uncharacterized protein n=1 Tax=Puccinia striiformis TaxID=27350 RepID=A0A2S4VAB6_9BASI|nr:hypothetical protein PSHT_10378 [Puccinia striiformis]